MKRGLVWFRRDLRLDDQAALSAACRECDEVVPLFVFDEPLLRSHQFGSGCVNFMLGCLRELDAGLRQRGSRLVWRRGDPVQAVVQAAREFQVEAVYWNRDYEPGAIERDRAAESRLGQMGVAARTFKDHVVFEAEELRGSTGEPLQRYSAFRARWWAKWRAETPALHAIPALRPIRPTAVPSDARVARALPTAVELGYESVPLWIEPGERSATERLRWFLNGPIRDYVAGRNRPAIDGTSKLSPHFRFGSLSVRRAIHAALRLLERAAHASRPDVLTWIDELVWREFFQQVLSAFPAVVGGPFRTARVPAARGPGAERDRLFHAWCEGRTGYPIIDAGMRQLNQAGWMHNRVRMVVASFLVKDLRLDWQSGERYFMQHLLDADTGANNGNWQWSAGTGTDAMRGYRIFNPALQSRKFDPEGAYIRQYVPELAAVPPRFAHEPHLMSLEEQARARCRIGRDYPSPIVDHQAARQDYLDRGKQLVRQ